MLRICHTKAWEFLPVSLFLVTKQDDKNSQSLAFSFPLTVEIFYHKPCLVSREKKTRRKLSSFCVSDMSSCNYVAFLLMHVGEVRFAAYRSAILRQQMDVYVWINKVAAGATNVESGKGG